LNNIKNDIDIPISQKYALTIDEASAYFGIGLNKLRKISSGDNCPFVLWVGNKRLIKRIALEQFLNNQFSV